MKRRNVRHAENAPTWSTVLLLPAMVLAAAGILLIQSPYARLYPAAVLAGVVARARTGRNVQIALLIAAVASGPLIWHLATTGTAAAALAALADTSPAGGVDYVREHVLDTTPVRAWLLLTVAVLLGFGVVELARARGVSPGLRATSGNRVLAAGPMAAPVAAAAAIAVAAAAPRVLERGREIRHAWEHAQGARRDELRLLSAAAAGSARLRELPVARRNDVTVVLYIGESTTRWNWSLYGYPRQTNAPLARHASSDRFVAFAQAVSGDAHPSSAPGARVSTLSFLHRRGPSGTVSLSGVLDKAGISTEWIVNSARTGERRRFYDHELLPRLQATLERPGPGRLVVMEAHAGHLPYCANIPAGRLVRWDDWMSQLSDRAVWGQRRGTREDLDCYDAAMHYVSANVRDILLAADESPEPTAVIYVADHGEDVWRQASRYEGSHSVRHEDVPLFAYFNAPFGDRYPDAVRRARGNTDRPFPTAWLFDAVLDLYGVEGPGTAELLDARKSLFAEGVESAGRSLAFPASGPGSGGDYLALARRTRHAYTSAGRLCAHRANTLFKYLEAKAAFDCVEADIVLERVSGTTRAFVFHPPRKGESRRNPGLEVGPLLRNAGLPRGRLWLDVKNLTEANSAALLTDLNAVVPAARRSEVLIESPNLALARSPAARAMAAAGYTLSFYLPTETAIGCSARFDLACERAARGFAGELGGSAFSGLSFDARGAGLARAVRATMSAPPILNTWAQRWPATANELALLEQVQMYLVEMPGGFDY